MGIVVACRCGQAFEADLDLAGKVVQCPVCRSPLVVPTPTPPDPSPSYVPRRYVSAISRESSEAAQSVGTFLVAGVVIFLLVLGLSAGIVGYIRWNHLLAKVPSLPTTAPAAAAGPVPVAGRAAPSADHSVAGNTAVPQGWTRYDHPTARYSVVLPAPPEIIDRTLESPAGDRVFHIFTSVQNEHAYESCREFRASKIVNGQENETYDALAKRRSDEIGGSILRSENIHVNGRPVRDVVLQGTLDGIQVRQYLRLIARDDSVLELSCRVPAGKERAAEIGGFLANFRMD